MVALPAALSQGGGWQSAADLLQRVDAACLPMSEDGMQRTTSWLGAERLRFAGGRYLVLPGFSE